MSTTHHPTEETLALFLDGSLDAGRRVVVAAHMELCTSCRRVASAVDELGGAHLQQLPPTAVGGSALEQLLSRLDTPLWDPGARPPADFLGLSKPLHALAPYELGAWRWIGPGVRWRAVNLPASTNGSRVFLLTVFERANGSLAGQGRSRSFAR
jgi:putative transcriptional regulator